MKNKRKLEAEINKLNIAYEKLDTEYAKKFLRVRVLEKEVEKLRVIINQIEERIAWDSSGVAKDIIDIIDVINKGEKGGGE